MEMTGRIDNWPLRVNAARPSMFKLCMGDPCVGMTDCTGKLVKWDNGRWELNLNSALLCTGGKRQI